MSAIREEISRLVKLQVVDKEIYRLIKEQKELPLRAGQLEADFEAKKINLKNLDDQLKSALVKRKERELALASKEEEIKKAQSQLYQLKTNKEYQAKLREIEGMAADKSVLEEDILKVFDEIDNLKAQVDKEGAFLKEEEVAFQAEKKKISDKIKDVEAALTELGGKRKIAAEEIDKKLLAAYERILKGRDGLGIVTVKDYSCQGCFMNVPAQVVNEIKMHDHLVFCENCTRILYLEEDL